MAVRGLSLAERHPYILKDDPAHPDNIEKEVNSRLSEDSFNSEEDRSNYRASIEEKVRAEVGEPTVFYLKNLLQEDRVLLGDMSAAIEQTKSGSMRLLNKSSDRAYQTVRRGLAGWKNFLDDKGNALPFDTVPGKGERGQIRNFVDDKCLVYLTQDMVRELSTEILRINGVTSELEKKFEQALRESQDQSSEDGLA
jgi:hypothetical protein